MFWIYHITLGIIISILLYPVYGANVLIIFISNLLIDADHYLWYIFRMKSLNLFKAFKFYKNRTLRLKYRNILHVFHTIEFLILIIVLSFYFEIFFLILIGIVIHLILDIIDLLMIRQCIDLRVWSFLEFFIIKIKRFL